MDLGRVADRPASGPLAAAAAARRGVYPPRYGTDLWDQRFRARIAAALRPGMRILDIGGGAGPSIPPGERPADTYYVGLDVSAHELERAPAGSYDEQVVGDITSFDPALAGRFDLAISWFVLEHVASMEASLDNIRSYLRPGGEVIAQLAGGRSPSGLANRAIPHRLATWTLSRFLDRDPASVFPAHYDRCTRSGLEPLIASGWENTEVFPIHAGAAYTRFSRLLTAAFVGYEEWVYRGSRDDLATYYLVTGRRAA